MRLEERARFLRAAGGGWELHRHRMPPPSAEALSAAQASGKLVFWRGPFSEPNAARQARSWPASGAGARAKYSRSQPRVIDRRGIRRDPEAHAGSLLRDLLDRGLARVDALRRGIEVDRRCRRGSGHPRAGGDAGRGNSCMRIVGPRIGRIKIKFSFRLSARTFIVGPPSAAEGTPALTEVAWNSDPPSTVTRPGTDLAVARSPF